VSDEWTAGTAADVVAGNRVRARGHELIVSRIEPAFFGNPQMVAFIEDTPDRWLKLPVGLDLDVEIQTP
jgi:hypothetical protein